MQSKIFTATNFSGADYTIVETRYTFSIRLGCRV